jgi:hypothetical protein
LVSTVICGAKGSDRTLLDLVHGELNRAGDFEGQRLTGCMSSIEELSQQWKEFTAVRNYIVTELTAVVVGKYAVIVCVQNGVQCYCLRISDINLLKPTCYVLHQQVLHSTTVRSAHTVFMCFVFI